MDFDLEFNSGCGDDKVKVKGRKTINNNCILTFDS